MSTKAPPNSSQWVPLNAVPLHEPVWQKTTLGPSLDHGVLEHSVGHLSIGRY